MTDRYVRSTDGNDADDGSTWALADATITGADAAPDAAGDTIWVSQSHAESTATSVTFTPAGTQTSPTKLLCGNDAAEPPTTLATTATVTTTGSSGITISGHVYVYGITFNCGTGTGGVSISLATGTGHAMECEQCTFNLVNTGSSSQFNIFPTGSSSSSKLKLVKSNMTFGNTAQSIKLSTGLLEWEGGGITSGSAISTQVFNSQSANKLCVALLKNVDFSGIGTSCNLIVSSATAPVFLRMTESKLPTSWTGGLMGATVSMGSRAEMINCNAGTTEYFYWYEDERGEIHDDTGVYLTTGYSKTSYGGSDVPYSLRFEPTSSANRFFALRSPWIPVWVSSTGSKTLSIEVAYDSATTLKDFELPLYVSYAGTSGSLVQTLSRETTADEQLIGSGTTLTNTSAAWTGTGGWTNKKTHTLSISVTVNEVGYVYLAVGVGVTTHTVYLNRVVTVA